MSEHEERIRSFADDCFVKGWDSYGAEPLTQDVIDRAARALSALQPSYTFFPVPTNDGGIVFEGTGDWDGVDLKVGP